MKDSSRDTDSSVPSVQQVNALIRHRRTIKPGDMSDAPIDTADILTILENANWAPTHGLTEPWRFRIFRGESRPQLAAGLSAIYKGVTPTEQFLESKFNKLLAIPLKAPVSIVVWMKRQDIRKIPEIEEVGAVACAIQNMHLTATAMGMAGFWSSPKILYSQAMNEWLGIGEEDKCLGIFYLGWPKDGLAWPTSHRNPVEQKLEWA